VLGSLFLGLLKVDLRAILHKLEDFTPIIRIFGKKFITLKVKANISLGN
jgi:hypothetical protein